MALYRAKVVSYDAGSHTAVVRLDGSAAQTLDGVAVSRGIAGAEMVPGRRVLVDTGDHGAIEDVVVFAAW
ncbi:MAG: hypothetical protein M0R74_01190 [Dehalococcoidia bacterium]|nr:hypothetical protein [Dehalococcoidia bacterium]